jgi:diguanylate cyclase (GGDEF)-like protein/PAS domain S-box-containing protein
LKLQPRHLSAIFLFAALLTATTGHLYHSSRKEERQHLLSHLEVLTTGYRASVNMFALTTETYFREVVSRPEVFALVRTALCSEGRDQDLARGQLYRLLYPSYARLRAHNLRHFHFHLPDGKSFLRFHQPDYHGDSALEIRATVRIANSKLIPARGFEISNFASGFRYVYPLLDNGEHLGSVDLSVPFKAIRDELARLEPNHEYAFVLDHGVVKEFLQKQLPLYSESALHPAFQVEDSGVILPDSLPPPSREATAINRQLRQDRRFQAQLARGKSFVIPTAVDGNPYAVTFMRVHDVVGREVGYLISYCPDPFLKLGRRNFFVSLASAWALIAALGLFFWRQECSRLGVQRERSHLKAVTETIIDGLYVTDEKGLITMVNPAACNILGYTPTEMIGREAHRLIHHHDASGEPPAVPPFYRKVLAGKIATSEENFWTAQGSILQVEVSSAPLQNEGGMIIGTVTAFRDITERKRQESELRRLATTDVLTGLANRRCVLDRLDQELARIQRFGKPMALLMADLDFFKRVNDTYGHAAGDEVLRQFAELARLTLRKIDLIGRFGGEEFIILLPGTDGEGARSYAERLRQKVAAKGFITEAGEVELTISIGATLVNGGDRDCDEVISRADRALYFAKQNGRNRVEFQIS